MHADVQRNFDRLKANPYPGRGIVVGKTAGGSHLAQIYWIMGRSENSRNRVFKSDGRRVYTAPADPKKVNDPSLIIYDAMRECRAGLEWSQNFHYVVSNGDQTNTIVQHMEASGTFYSAMLAREYEPDSPNYTPRIAAVCTPRARHIFQMAIQYRVQDGDCVRGCYVYEDMQPGVGMCLTTYTGDGSPLPSFTGPPYAMPIAGNGQEILDKYWDVLDTGNRVSLVVKLINVKSGQSKVYLKNQYVEI